MKRTLAPLVLLLGMPLFAHADTGDLLRKAQDAYAQGDYKQALALYDSVNITQTSAGLLFNIGNCWSKLDDTPHAILYYERALRAAPGSEDIQSNLDQARTKVVDRVNELPGFTLGSLWDRLQGGTDVDQWARRSLWGCAIASILLAVSLFLRQRAMKRAVLSIAAVGFVLTVCAAGLAAYRVHEADSRDEAIIMRPKVDILGEPHEGSTTLFILHAGTKLAVLQEQNGWCEVKLGNGSVGWVPRTALEVI
jgi:tetratricopeptide (TPR) repeat protein